MNLREQPPQSEMLKPRDKARIEVIDAHGWHCHYCEELDQPNRTVQWSSVQSSLGVQSLGRCRECGQKYVLRYE